VLGQGNLAPLFTTGWNIKSIRHSSIATSAINTITVSLQTSAHLFANSSVTISGLHGSVTPSGMLAVTAEDVWVKLAAWDLALGQVVLILAHDSLPDRVSTISITLENSAVGQEAPWPILIQTRSVRVGGLQRELMPAEEMDLADGIYSLFVIAGFTTKTISETSVTCGVSNRVALTLLGRVPLDARYHTIITITGLTGSLTNGSNLKVCIRVFTY
jgi:hypothetical protein